MAKKKVIDVQYDEWADQQYGKICDRYKRMLKALFNINEDVLSSTNKQTLSLRYARTIYFYMCYEKGVPYMYISKSINRKSNTSLHNIKLYKDVYKTDAYFKYLADKAINWDNHN